MTIQEHCDALTLAQVIGDHPTREPMRPRQYPATRAEISRGNARDKHYPDYFSAVSPGRLSAHSARSLAARHVD